MWLMSGVLDPGGLNIQLCTRAEGKSTVKLMSESEKDKVKSTVYA